MSENTLSSWIQEQLDINNWKSRDLAKRAHVSDTAISRILKNERGIGVETLVAIANAFHVSPMTVIRKAGLLPASANGEVSFEDWKYLLEKMTPEERDEVWRISKMKIELRREKEQTSRAKNFKPGKVRK